MPLWEPQMEPQIPPTPQQGAERGVPALLTPFPSPPANRNPASLARHEQFVWVSKWVDYSNKYGFGYQLSNRSIGVLFNNGTHMALSPNHK